MEKKTASAIMLTLLLIGMLTLAFNVQPVLSIANPANFTFTVDKELIANSMAFTSSYENITTHKGDLIINGTHTYVIENCNYTQIGNVYVRDYGTLIIKNSCFLFNQTTNWQYQIDITENAKIILENVDVVNFYAYKMNAWDYANVIMENVTSKSLKWDEKTRKEFYSLHFSAHDNTHTQVNGSNISYAMGFSHYSSADIYNSTFDRLFFGEYSQGEIRNVKVVLLFEVYNDAYVSIFDSELQELCFGIHGSSIEIEGLEHGFFSYWNSYENCVVLYGAPNITLFTTLINDWSLMNYDSQVHVNKVVFYSLISDGNSTTLVQDSVIYWLDSSWGYSNTRIIDSEVSVFSSAYFNGSVYFSNVTELTDITYIDYSHFYIFGNVTFTLGASIWEWTQSSIIRNFNVICIDETAKPVGDVELALYDKNETLVWEGVSDSYGYADFNLTFTDSNYTDTLTLKAAKADLYAAKNVTFLSDTPIILMVTPTPPPNQPPYTPTTVSQFRSDGVTVIPEGGTTPESTVVFKATVSDPNEDSVRLEIELRQIGEPFTEQPTPETISDYVPSGTQVTITRYGLVNADYHWRYRAKDIKGDVSDWTEFGTVGNTDFTVYVDTIPPTAVITSGPSGTIYFNDATFTWTGLDDVTPPIRLVYSYYLEGYDSDWSGWTSETSKQYTDLLSGHYVFKVKAKDEADNIGTPHERSFTVSLQKTISVMFAGMTVFYTRVDQVDGEDIYVVSKISAWKLGGVLGIYEFSITRGDTTLWRDRWVLPGITTKDYIFESFEVRASDRINVRTRGVTSSLRLFGVSPNVDTASTAFDPDAPIETSSIWDPLINWIGGKLFSPGELRVYDSQGRVTGLVNGEVKEEIPDSGYLNNTVMILSTSGSYHYEVAGTEDGFYGLVVASAENEEVTTFTATDIPTSPNAIHHYTIDWDALSIGEEGVTVQVDSDGDGVFEHTFTSDSELTQSEFLTQTAPPPLSISISPLSASILVGQSVTFTSTVSGGYTPYSYQWYLNGNPVSGATSASWTFTPTTSGICYIYLKVTDAKGNTTQSDTARITVATVPVGGYSVPIRVQTKTEPVLPYIALIAILTAIFTKLRPKTKRKR